MPIRTRFEPLDRDIDLIIRETLSPEARSTVIANFAKEQLVEAQRANKRALGFVPPHQSFVDGSPSSRLESVRPDGTISFEFSLINDMLAWIKSQLQTHSPVRSGDYKNSHLLLADGAEFDPSGPTPPAAEYIFINAQPYGRKIERGLSRKAPDGVYQVVAQLAAQRFGNVAKISFSYRAFLASGSILTISRIGPLQVKRRKNGQFARGSHVRAGSQRETALRQPAIVITV